MKNNILSLLVLLMMGCKAFNTGSLSISELTVEMQQNSEGVSAMNPHFSWQLMSNKQDVMQSAYQIEVADSEETLKAGSGLLWNSGHVDSDRSLIVEYSAIDLHK